MKIHLLASFWTGWYFRFLFGLLVFPLLAANTLEGQTNHSELTGQPSQMTSGSLTMESFWEHSPIIRKMVYQTISPDGAREQFLVRLDGTNALMCPVDESGQVKGISTGRFQSTFWHYYPANKTLVLVNSRINKITPRPIKPLPWPGRTVQGGPTTEMEHFLFQRRIDQIMNLGLPEIDRSTGVQWDVANHRLKAIGAGEQSDNFKGTPLVLQFTQDGNLPTNGILRAVLEGQTRTSGILETYKYDSNFFDGLFPIEFTRFAASPTPNDGQDVAQYRVRFKEFDVTDQPIPDAEIDPSQIFGKVPGLTLIVWSNNVNYAVSRTGWQPIQTAEEVAKGIPENLRRRHPRSLFFLKTTLIVFLVSSLVGPIWAAWRRRKKMQTQQTS